MNRKQRIVLFIMAALIILIFLFPPYVMRSTISGKQTESGYGFIFDLPIRALRYSTVDVPLLFAQIFGVLVAGGIIWFALKEQKVEKASNIVDDLTKIEKLPEDRPTENLSSRLEELKAQKDELERKISFEVDQIRRLELKEELKKIKGRITQIERR